MSQGFGDKPNSFGSSTGFGGGFGKPSGFGANAGENNRSGSFGKPAESGFGATKTSAFGGNANSSGFGEKSGSFGSGSRSFGGNRDENQSGKFGDGSRGFGGNRDENQSGKFGDGSRGFGGNREENHSGGFGGGSRGFGGNRENNQISGFGGNSRGFGGNCEQNQNAVGDGFGRNSRGFGGDETQQSGFGERSKGFGGGSQGFGGGSQGFGGSSQGFGGRNEGFRDSNPKSGLCFNCQQPGHNSKDCPEERRGGGGGNRNCFNCNQPGHTSHDCPEPRKPRDGGGCYNCQEVGHNFHDCPQPRKPRDFGNSSRGFGNDTTFRHNNERSGDTFGSSAGGFGADGAGGGRVCFNCGEEGHRSAECTQPRPEKKPMATHVPEEEKVEDVFELQKIEEGNMFNKFFDTNVTITRGGKSGNASQCKSFEEAGLPERILRNVKQAGYSKTTPIQQYALPLIMEGSDIMACAQTGSGKTAAFLLPIMTKLLENQDLNTAGEAGCYPRCIILTPTRELALQIYNEGRKFAYQTMLEIKPVYGGVQVSHSMRQLESGATIIVGTVGRMQDFIGKGFISLQKVKYVVLDEADRMLDVLGFGDNIEKILQSPGMAQKEDRQTLMFSATYPDCVQTAARSFLRNDYAMITIDKIGSANKCVVQEFERLEKPDKKEKLLELLGVDIENYTTTKDAEVYKKKTIVFVAQRAMADTLASILSGAQIPAITTHGAREQREREEAMRMFRNGSKPVLIATAVAERGLDIKGVDHVINYDLPRSIDDYIHRIGRTGRVGNAGRATSFVTEDDTELIPHLVQVLADAEQIVPEFMQNVAGNYGASGFGSCIAQEEEEQPW
ncbi:unnamed protein product [Caenorhabditis bovis]|uniref:RNA helicase n=1 Tax=Caenorhabditis bovis TaxID=2654633 RepID=A0A8S1F8V4_9PELO|nr:unnamed protein product [Caenorhabditis bovis]